ncbi:hypothetical protein [Streptomyces tubercidicus]|uniref:hypothetical protein n=1 Tax=Streptomyces tubercidicus TaxID=47759 RepID=UPI0036768E00
MPQRAVFRSVEYGYAMVRQSVHGVATAVDHQGRIRGLADYFTADRQTLITEVPVRPRTDTLYSLTGDLFALLCAGGTLVVVALGVVRGRRGGGGSVPRSPARPAAVRDVINSPEA